MDKIPLTHAMIEMKEMLDALDYQMPDTRERAFIAILAGSLGGTVQRNRDYCGCQLALLILNKLEEVYPGDIGPTIKADQKALHELIQQLEVEDPMNGHRLCPEHLKAVRGEANTTS